MNLSLQQKLQNYLCKNDKYLHNRCCRRQQRSHALGRDISKARSQLRRSCCTIELQNTTGSFMTQRYGGTPTHTNSARCSTLALLLEGPALSILPLLLVALSTMEQHVPMQHVWSLSFDLLERVTLPLAATCVAFTRSNLPRVGCVSRRRGAGWRGSYVRVPSLRWLV